MLQFITDTKSDTPVIDQIKAVIKGGCKWVQISMPDASDSEIREAVEAIKPLSIEKEVFLILESNAELAKELNVGGVCLHKDDIPASKARMILGPAAVIGVVVDSFQDILSVSSLDIDYFMLAPFRKSDCKNDESPELGVEGVKSICDKMEGNEINIPRVAEGGITYDDIPSLLNAGINGIAVSKAIANSVDITKETEKFIGALPMA